MTAGTGDAGTRKVLIVADDLTGAMDSAGPFARRGLVTRVVTDPRSLEDGDALEAALAGAAAVSVNTETRHLPPAEAAARVAAAIRRLAGAAAGGPRTGLLLKKIDSTLRGQVVAETLAALAASGRRLALVAPAMPAQGRTVRGGAVFVGGVPLAETAIGRDALSPPPRRPLAQLLRSADPGLIVRLVRRPQDAALVQAPAERQAWIVDADTPADMLAIARGTLPDLASILLVGAAGLAEAMAEAWVGPARPLRPPGLEAGMIVFAVGSRAPQSAEQVAQLARRNDTILVPAPLGEVDAEALGTRLAGGLDGAGQLVLQAVPDPGGRQADAAEVAANLGRSVCALADRLPVAGIVATGGDTARAVLAAGGCTVVEVAGDLLPGIPLGRMRLQGDTRWLVTKAGGFGAPDAMMEIVRRLRAPPDA